MVIILWSYKQERLMQKIPAAQFKAQCLAVMDQVADSGRAVVVTKHGKPVVQITPVQSNENEIFGFMAGKARIVGDIENTIPVSDWNLPE
jgi:prevent-host-death family protein